MSIACKHCVEPIEKHRVFLRAEEEFAKSWVQGIDMEAHWEPVAAGVFCSLLCLSEHLSGVVANARRTIAAKPRPSTGPQDGEE